ncbi:MAG: hypothetical protein F6K11_00280 [Leptolyngbya sp. SIO3F4]|nr:hypothetical protein [Leptolyngbya sp. SIO3F4]
MLAAIGASAARDTRTGGGHSDDGVDTGVVTFSPGEVRRILSHSPLPDPPDDPTNRVADDPNAAAFGRTLFFDPRLSGTGDVSCATCHEPHLGFADRRQLAVGAGESTRHSMSLWNVAYNRWFFWDGRSDTLWGQAVQPIERDVEMDSTRVAAVRLVLGDPELRAAYEGIFGEAPEVDPAWPPTAMPHPTNPDHVEHVAWMSIDAGDRAVIDETYANIGKSIAAFERTLLSRRAPFDVFVEGIREGDAAKLEALSPAAQRGLQLFIGRAECRSCHLGPNFTDGEFHDIMVPPLGGGMPRDQGRYKGARGLSTDPFNATGPWSDDREGTAAMRTARLVHSPALWGQFKTPTLRNVALSPPYMHQGQFESLDRVIEYYSTLEGAVRMHHHQESVLIPLELTAGEKADLRSFLESLTDDSGVAKFPVPPAEAAGGETRK